MFYRPADGHGLPHNPFTAIVAPRPIAWISSRGTRGDNLAPYSFFNAVGYSPPQIMFASTGIKDTLTNIRETGVFAVNIVSAALFHAMSATSATLPHGTDEFTIAGLERTDCALIPCPRVVGAPATLECEVVQEIALRGQDNIMTIGEVIGVHLRDDCLRDGRFDITRYQPMARAGYQDYARVDRLITLARPDET